MRIELDIHTSRLRFAPVDGRRTFYGMFRFGPFRAFVQRWDTNRTNGVRKIATSRDGLMCWSAGINWSGPRLKIVPARSL